MPAIKNLSQVAAKILERLVEGVDYESPKRIDNTNGTYMYVSVNKVGENRYSVAHYYVQNGDLMCDPDVVFFKASSGLWFPVMFQQANPPVYHEPIEFNDDDTIKAYRPRMLRDLVSFCNTWMSNIREQQGRDLSGRAKAA
jgi:hypothetical protein